MITASKIFKQIYSWFCVMLALTCITTLCSQCALAASDNIRLNIMFAQATRALPIEMPRSNVQEKKPLIERRAEQSTSRATNNVIESSIKSPFPESPSHLTEHASACTSVIRESKIISRAGQRVENEQIFQQVLTAHAGEPVSIRISLSHQSLFLFLGKELALASPICSGRCPGWTPIGYYKILEKDACHRSNLYGTFLDQDNHVIKKNVDVRRDMAPRGSHFRGASMLYFMKITEKGVGLHVGSLPGHPVSHGCIRLPLKMAKVIYQWASLNTPVIVEE